jgi:hypothetical protein
VKSEEYKILKGIVNKKTSKLKIEVDELQIKMDELDELVEAKTKKVIKRRLIKQVIEAIQTDLEALEGRMLNKVGNDYYDYIKKQADSVIRAEFNKGVKFKHRVIASDIVHEHEPIEMINDGWRIVYVGPLKFETGNRKDVFIFEKPVKNKAFAKVKIITKTKGNIKKKTKKVKRNPG